MTATALYFDCFSGASGDMIVGALIDAGCPLEAIRDHLDRLGLSGWETRIEDVTRGGIRATRFVVEVSDTSTPRTHRDITELLERADMEPRVRERALRIFAALATAEAKVHGVSIEEVHFHEVGALDAIVDVVAASAALEHFAPFEVSCSQLPLGTGFVDTDHGRLPVPAPAVVELLRNVPVTLAGEGELVTPTGAAILSTVVDRWGSMPSLTVHGVGYGSGTRELETPNLLRVLVGTHAANDSATEAIVIECNLDDMSPELLPHVIESSLVAGAQDAWITPILMKKGRPAYTLSVLVDPSALDRVTDTIYRETTTFGLRRYSVTKDALVREWIEVSVGSATVRVKIARRGGDVVTVSPEFEDASAAARASGLPLKEVYARATELATARIRQTL